LEDTIRFVRAVDSQGRVMIPVEIRNRLGILPGTELECGIQDGAVTMRVTNEAAALLGRLNALLEDFSRGMYDNVTGGGTLLQDSVRQMIAWIKEENE